MSRRVSRPTKPKTHEECRLESCCCCGGKVKPESGRSKIIPVSEKMVLRIQKWAKPEFNMTVMSYPLGLCSVCRVQLSECERLGVVKTRVREKWDQFRLQDIQIPWGQEADTCRCNICSAWRTKGIGRKGYNSTVIENVKIKPTGSQKIEQENVKKRQKGPCGICFQEKIGPGIHHPCGPESRKKNWHS